MRVYREVLTITATASSMTVTSTPVPPGFMRIYEGRVIVNLTAARGQLVTYLGNPTSWQILGQAALVSLMVSPGVFVGFAEEAGRRNYWEGEYWTLQVGSLVTGDTIKISLLGTEMTIFQYQKGDTY